MYFRFGLEMVCVPCEILLHTDHAVFLTEKAVSWLLITMELTSHVNHCHSAVHAIIITVQDVTYSDASTGNIYCCGRSRPQLTCHCDNHYVSAYLYVYLYIFLALVKPVRCVILSGQFLTRTQHLPNMGYVRVQVGSYKVIFYSYKLI
jgi:hypothetical protein